MKLKIFPERCGGSILRITAVALALLACVAPLGAQEAEDSQGPGDRTDQTDAAPIREPDPAPDQAESIEITEDGAEILVGADDVTTPTLALLRRLEARHLDVKAVKATFDQLKISEIFLEEIASTGTLWFRKPDFFRCDYDPPDRLTNLIVKEAIYVYVPEIEQVEVYRFASESERHQQLHSMVIGFGFKTAEIVREYEVASSEGNAEIAAELEAAGLDPAAKALLTMIPKPPLMETSPFTQLKLWIDKESLMPEKIWFEDYNGDRTSITLGEIELDVEFSEGLFDPVFPPGTEWIDKSKN